MDIANLSITVNKTSINGKMYDVLSYDEYVRVYGEIPITYKDPKIDKTTAIMKAKAYLAAHIRDFNMGVNRAMLTEPEIDIGDIVTVENPQTVNNLIKTSKKEDPE